MGNRTLSSKASAEGWLVDESAILDHAESPYHRGWAPNASCAPIRSGTPLAAIGCGWNWCWTPGEVSSRLGLTAGDA